MLSFQNIGGELEAGGKDIRLISHSLLEKMLINIGFSQKGDAYQSTTYSGEEECE